MATTQMSLKLLIDKDRKKVLFAEAGKDFVDFLICLFALPLATAVSLLRKSATIGCMSNLYSSIENLSDDYLQSNQKKDALLNPVVSVQVTSSSLLLPGVQARPSQNQTFQCPICRVWVSDYPRTSCRNCGAAVNTLFGSFSLNEPVQKNRRDDGEGGYVKGVITYMVTDDLSVSPMSMISGVSLLNKFKVKDFGSLEEKVVQFGKNECLELLKASLLENTVLTEVFLMKNRAQDASSV